MNPVRPSDAEVAYWSDRDGVTQTHVVIGGPQEAPDVIPCPALVAQSAGAIHVVYELEDHELADLVHGGRLWLTTRGQLPVHLLEIIPKDDT